MTDWSDREDYVAFLEARVEVLEEALVRRSRTLRALQREVCATDLLQISRLEAGLPPLPDRAYDLALWTETTRLTAAEVEPTMRDLWRSLTPYDDGAEPPAP